MLLICSFMPKSVSSTKTLLELENVRLQPRVVRMLDFTTVEYFTALWRVSPEDLPSETWIRKPSVSGLFSGTLTAEPQQKIYGFTQKMTYINWPCTSFLYM